MSTFGPKYRTEYQHEEMNSIVVTIRLLIQMRATKRLQIFHTALSSYHILGRQAGNRFRPLVFRIVSWPKCFGLIDIW